MPETVVQQQQQVHRKSSEGHDVEPPAEFVCPISLEVMTDPVMSKNGQNYDRAAILEWLNAGNVNCPLTRQPLKPSLLVPNANLRIKIMRWKMENGIAYDYVNSEKKTSEFVGYVDPRPMSLKSLYRSNAAALVASVGAETADSNNNNSTRQEERRRQQQEDSSSTSSRAEDDLSDLLQLYNEVLELTEPMLQPRNVQTNSTAAATPQTQAPADQAENTAAEEPSDAPASSNKKRWGPKLFSKKTEK